MKNTWNLEEPKSLNNKGRQGKTVSPSDTALVFMFFAEILFHQRTLQIGSPDAECLAPENDRNSP